MNRIQLKKYPIGKIVSLGRLLEIESKQVDIFYDAMRRDKNAKNPKKVQNDKTRKSPELAITSGPNR